MEDIVKWCITAVCALLPAIAIYLVINVLSWKSGKKSAPRNEIAQPRQYLWVFVGSTVLWSAMALFALAVMVFSIMGPTFGGFIVDNADWQWIYLVNIPVGILSISMVHANIEELETRKEIKKTISIFYPQCEDRGF